jgi:Tfp pilus assembly protein PilO
MPKNTNIENLLKVFIECGISPIFTIEKVMTNNKVSQLFIYIGD